MNPKQFLTLGGLILLLLGIIGFLGLLNQNTTPFFWLDTSENIAHTVLGVVALAAVFVPGLNKALEPFYKWIVMAVGVIALFFGIYAFLVGSSTANFNTFGVANLESPADGILHVVVGVWALYAALRPPETAKAM